MPMLVQKEGVQKKRSAKKGPGEVDHRGLAASFSPGGSIKAAAATIGAGCGNLTSNRHKNPPEKTALPFSRHRDMILGSIGRPPMISQRLVTILQAAGAALGIPAAAAGSYTAYQAFFSPEVTCQKLRTNILATMERRIAAEAKHVLLRKDVTEFDKTCGESDPDARSIFQAALQDAAAQANRAQRPSNAPAAAAVVQPKPVAPAAAAVAQPEPAAAASPPASAPRKQPLTIFGAPGSSEQHGWVAISRKDKAEGSWVVNFTGYAISETSLPPAGTVLSAQRNVPVWADLPAGMAQDQSKLQNRVPPGACVRVLATRGGPLRLWAEVAPASCS
jgi:hypothetical protein